MQRLGSKKATRCLYRYAFHKVVSDLFMTNPFPDVLVSVSGWVGGTSMYDPFHGLLFDTGSHDFADASHGRCSCGRSSLPLLLVLHAIPSRKMRCTFTLMAAKPGVNSLFGCCCMPYRNPRLSHVRTGREDQSKANFSEHNRLLN